MHNIFCCKHKSKEILPKKYSVLKRDDVTGPELYLDLLIFISENTLMSEKERK